MRGEGTRNRSVQVDENFTRSRLWHIQFLNLRREAPRLVIDNRLVLLRKLRGSHTGLVYTEEAIRIYRLYSREIERGWRVDVEQCSNGLRLRKAKTVSGNEESSRVTAQCKVRENPEDLFLLPKLVGYHTPTYTYPTLAPITRHAAPPALRPFRRFPRVLGGTSLLHVSRMYR